MPRVMSGQPGVRDQPIYCPSRANQQKFESPHQTKPKWLQVIENKRKHRARIATKYGSRDKQARMAWIAVGYRHEREYFGEPQFNYDAVRQCTLMNFVEAINYND